MSVCYGNRRWSFRGPMESWDPTSQTSLQRLHLHGSYSFRKTTWYSLKSRPFFPLEANRLRLCHDPWLFLGCCLAGEFGASWFLVDLWICSIQRFLRGDPIRHVLFFLRVPRTRKQEWPRAGNGEGRFKSVSFSPELSLPSFFPACRIVPGLQPSSWWCSLSVEWLWTCT